ncbi:MAG: hypothetical protein IJO76_05840 [Clostridia bacterium]|nr:hypothetical protein [Clostridia bacterium]
MRKVMAKRLAALLAVCALLTSLLVVGVTPTSATTNSPAGKHYNVVLDADGLTTENAWTPKESVSSDSSHALSGNAYKWTMTAGNAATLSFPATGYEDETAFFFWVDASDLTADAAVVIELSDGTNTIKVSPDASEYSILAFPDDDPSSIEMPAVSANGAVTVRAGFVGVVAIDMNCSMLSFDGMLAGGTVTSAVLTPTTDGTLYFDDIGFAIGDLMDDFATAAFDGNLEANRDPCALYGHKWLDATCTAPKTCERCGDSEGTVADHTYVGGVCNACGAAAPVVEFETFQSYETETERNNAPAGGAHIGVPDSARITNRFVTATPINGSYSRELYWDGEVGAGADYLVQSVPASTLTNTTGVYVRIKVNTTAPAPLVLLATADADGTISDWPNGTTKAKFYNLNGDLVATSEAACPAGFDGYAFIPCGDVQGKAFAAMLMATWYGNAYGGTTTTSWWSAGPNGGKPTILFDDIGYYYTSNGDAVDYATLVSKLKALEIPNPNPGGGSNPNPNPNPGGGTNPTYKYEIVQDYEDENKGEWGHAGFVNELVNQTPVTKDPVVTQNPLSGSNSFFTQIMDTNSGSDFLIADAATMQPTIENPTGIFFRLKTNRSADTTMYLSTVGAGTTLDAGVHAWGANSAAAYSIMNWQHNNACIGARYYALDGTDKTISEDGRVVPANFDGYVFIPVNLSTKTLDGLTIFYAQNWALTGSYNGTLANWYGFDRTTVVGFDNVGFYSASTAADCKAIVAALNESHPPVGGITPPPASGTDFEIFQSYETEAERNNAAAVGSHIGVPDSAMITNRFMTFDPINGGYSRELYWDGEVGSGADYLVKSAPASTLANTSGVFVRIKTNTTKPTPFALWATEDNDGTISDWPSHATPAKFYNMNGELVATSASMCPAGFDGYAFIPCGDVAGKTVSAMLLATWFADHYSGVTTTAWWSAGPDGGRATILFDDIGYYYAPNGDNAELAELVSDLKDAENGEGSAPEVYFETIQGYESEAEKNNAAAPGSHIGVPDSAMITNRFVTANALKGEYSRELFWDGEAGSGADYLVLSAPASTLANTTGVYIRIKTNSTGPTPFALWVTADTDGTISDWPNAATAAKFYNLDGELVTTSNCICPAGFDGYAFIPCGNVVENKAIAAMLLAKWYGDAYSGMDTAAWWSAGPDGGKATLLFDDIGYYCAPNGMDAEYTALIDELKAASGEGGGNTGGGTTPTPPSTTYGFEVIQNYEGENTNGGLWGHAGYVGEQANKRPTTIDPTAPQTPLSGNGSFFSEMGFGEQGSDYLIADAYTMQPSLSNPMGIFFRMKTNRDANTTMFLTTIGASTPTQDWAGNNNKKYSLMNYIMNNACVYARWFALDGTEKTVDGDGRVIPANFDGYVFIPFDVASKSLEGLTIYYAPSWALSGSYGGSIANWYNDDPTTVVGFDNIGYYSISGSATASIYKDIMTRVENGEGYTANPNPNPPALPGIKPDGSDMEKDDPNSGTYDYEMLNTFETEEEKANIGPHMYGETFFSENSPLGGTTSLRLDNIGIDAVEVALLTEAPKPTVDNANGLFFRFKANNEAGGDMCMSSGRPILGYDEWTGEYTVLWKDVNKGRLVYVWMDGTVGYSDSVIPANFDGYLFVMIPDTINQRYADGWWKGVRAIFPKWWAGFTWYGTTQFFDNVGYCNISDIQNADIYRRMVNDLNAAYPAVEGSGQGIPEMQKYMTYEDDLEPTDKGNSTFFRKPYLYFNTEMPIAVKWSVQVGKAELTYLQDPNDATLAKHGVMVTFGSTGRVVIRAELVGDSKQYVDYTFSVRTDSARLDDALFEAGMIVDYATGLLYEMLVEEMDEAFMVLMDDSATQYDYNYHVAALEYLMQVFDNGGVFEDAQPDDGTETLPDDGTENVPDDGTDPLPDDGTENVPDDGTDPLPDGGEENAPTDGDENGSNDGNDILPDDGTENLPGDEGSSPVTGERSLVVSALILAVLSGAVIFILKRKVMFSK